MLKQNVKTLEVGLLLWLVCFKSIAADTITLALTVRASGVTNVSATISVGPDETAQVLHLFTPNSTKLAVTIGTNTIYYSTGDLIGAYIPPSTGSSTANGSNLPVIAGPATLFLSGNGPGISCLCTVQIIRQANLSIPSNAVVIPADTNGPVTIVLESSEDLVNWTAANPGTYGTSTQKRFSRVRALR